MRSCNARRPSMCLSITLIPPYTNNNIALTSIDTACRCNYSSSLLFSRQCVYDLNHRHFVVCRGSGSQVVEDALALWPLVCLSAMEISINLSVRMHFTSPLDPSCGDSCWGEAVVERSSRNMHLP